MPTSPTPKPKRPRGKPPKGDVPKTKRVEARVTPNTYAWVKGQYEGWLPDLLERLSKQGPLADRFNREAREEMLTESLGNDASASAEPDHPYKS